MFKKMFNSKVGKRIRLGSLYVIGMIAIVAVILTLVNLIPNFMSWLFTIIATMLVFCFLSFVVGDILMDIRGFKKEQKRGLEK